MTVRLQRFGMKFLIKSNCLEQYKLCIYVNLSNYQLWTHIKIVLYTALGAAMAVNYPRLVPSTQSCSRLLWTPEAASDSLSSSFAAQFRTNHAWDVTRTDTTYVSRSSLEPRQRLEGNRRSNGWVAAFSPILGRFLIRFEHWFSSTGSWIPCKGFDYSGPVVHSIIYRLGSRPFYPGSLKLSLRSACGIY